MDEVCKMEGASPGAVDQEVAMIDRYAGCLLGQCLGDALGFVVEGYPPATCRDYVETFLRSGHAGKIGRGQFPFGQYTDDSQLARELAQSFVRRGGFDAADYAQGVAAIFSEGRIVGRGRSTEQAARRIAQGVSWEKSGTPAPSAGNGSAMRAGPVGLFEPGDREALRRVAHDQGRMTHADPRCSAGAVVVARAVALALGRPGRRTDVLQDLADLATRHDPVLADAVLQLDTWLDLDPEQAAEAIACAGKIQGAALDAAYSDGWQGISPFVTPSVLWSLYSFLRSPDDYWEVICTAIAVGGDVDTTAAMAGAMVGARVGQSGLPQPLVQRVNDQGVWGHDKLAELACQVHAVVHGVGE